MESISVLKRDVTDSSLTRLNFIDKDLITEKTRSNPMLENILSEGGSDFFQYLSWAGLVREPNLMVLSSMHHYYYDHNDMTGIKTLINLKKLNHVKHLESFLHTLYRILPSESFFVGCFKNSPNNTNKKTFCHTSKIFSGIINIFDNRSERNLSKRYVTRLIEENGFKIIDFTDINGVTYFWAQNKRKSGL
jgi:hypothetical protein